jgi:flagellar hook assembly protein FlgD
MFGRPFPNPARGPVSFPVSLPVAGPVRMEIHDVTGRLIASSSSPLAAGVGVLSWDGRDTRDRTVSSGIYLVSIAAAGESRSFRVLRVR